MIVANTFGSFAMLVVMALGGYIISRGQPNTLSMSTCFQLDCILLLISLFKCDRSYTEVVDLGFLVFSLDVYSKCSFCK